jgi:hypothetical protein
MTMRRVALLLALGGFTLTAATLLWAADDRAAALEKKLQLLLEERVATANRGVEANQAAYDSGTVTLDVLIKSRSDLAEARLAVAKGADERRAAIRELYQGYLQMEDSIAKLYKTGSRGGEANSMAMITVARQTAEIQLLEEQLRNAAGK